MSYCVLSTVSAQAQSSSTATATGSDAPASAAPATATSTAQAPAQLYKIPSPGFGPYKLKAGIKSTNTTARQYEYDDTKGRRMKLKQEIFAGAQHENGWGGYMQAVSSGSTFAQETPKQVNGLQAADPSFTLLHPDFYKGTSATVSGQFRQYFPVSDRSRDRNNYQAAYYLTTAYKVTGAWSLWNQLVPRYNFQGFYKKGDTTYFYEDLSNVTYKVSNTISMGLGQWTQVEVHEAEAMGTTVDVMPFVKYTPIANVSIEPRLYFPAYTQNRVSDMARAVALDSARAELYAQIAL